jgi:hypothetical protein
MKKRYTLVLIISMLYAGLFAQAYRDFKIPEKHIRADRPSAYRALLDTYHAYGRQSSLKSAAEFSLSLDTAQIQYNLGNDQYLPIVNEILRYDALGNMGRSVVVALNPDTYVWENSDRTELFYDSNGNLFQVVNSEWDDVTKAWVAAIKTDYTYDAGDQLVQVIESEWSVSSSQFIDNRKMELSYTPEGLKIQLLIYGWDPDPGSWVEAWKYEYSYDVNDAMTLETEYQWNESLADWVLSWKTEYSYNGLDQLSLKEEFNWDSDLSQWINSWKSALSYDAGGNVDQQFDSIYLEPDGPWQERWLASYTFDAQNNPLTETYSQWVESSGMLELNTKYEYLYENETLLADLMAPPTSWFWPDYREQIVNKPLGHIGKGYNTDISAFETVYQEVYFYNTPGFPLGIGTESVPLVSIYPNPVRDFLSLNFSGASRSVLFELYDASGRRILIKEVQRGERLNLEEVQNGLYLYRITSGEQVQTGKLLKE